MARVRAAEQAAAASASDGAGPASPTPAAATTTATAKARRPTSAGRRSGRARPGHSAADPPPRDSPLIYPERTAATAARPAVCTGGAGSQPRQPSGALTAVSASHARDPEPCALVRPARPATGRPAPFGDRREAAPPPSVQDGGTSTGASSPRTRSSTPCWVGASPLPLLDVRPPYGGPSGADSHACGHDRLGTRTSSCSGWPMRPTMPISMIATGRAKPSFSQAMKSRDVRASSKMPGKNSAH